MTDPASGNDTWNPWRVAPDSGFETRGPNGRVGLIQKDDKNFVVTDEFRFSQPAVEKDIVSRLRKDGKSPEEAQRAYDDARTFTPTEENPTDMASIPPFMRWFENSYGKHTLAAIIHDELIVDGPNTGALGSDTLADRFFRKMMQSAGVPWLKRWIMWAAVAMRSRWAAEGVTRLKLIAWGVVAVVGIAAFVNAVGAAFLDWGHLVDPWWLLGIAVVLPFASAVLWGKQYGASFVAAAAALWILPAAIFAALGYVAYWILERLASAIGWLWAKMTRLTRRR